MKYLYKVSEDKAYKHINLLNKIIFCEFDKIDINMIFNFFEKKQFKKGQIVYREGDPIYGLYLIKKGHGFIQEKSKLKLNIKINI